MKRRPASLPPLIPNVSTEPKPLRRYFFASACDGWLGRLGCLTHDTAGCRSSHFTSSSALSLCRCTRSDSVSSPCRNRNELKGESAGPKSRRPSTRARIANAMLPNGPFGPNVSQNLSPW